MLKEISNFIKYFLMEHRNDPFDVLEFTIDFSSSNQLADESDISRMAPYLNLYLCNLENDTDAKQALEQANEEDDFGFYYDLVDIAKESEFELELSGIFKTEEEILEKEKAEFISTLREALKSNSSFTKNIKTVFFHYVDEFDIVYF